MGILAEWLIGITNTMVRLLVAVFMVLAVVQMVGVIIFAAAIISYHNDPQWYWWPVGGLGLLVFFFADPD